MLGSSSSSVPRGVEVSSPHRPRAARRDKTVGSSSRPVAPPVQEDQWITRSRATPGRTGAPEPRRPTPCQADPPRRSKERPSSACQIYDGSECPDSDSLQRRRSRGRSSDLASAPTVQPVAEPSAASRRLKSLLIRGSGAPKVHVSLVAGRGQGSSPTVVEVVGSAPERAGEDVATTETAGRSGAAPESARTRRAAPE
jgi:hypothetical protein